MTLKENVALHLDKLSDASKEAAKHAINHLYEEADRIDAIKDTNEMSKQAIKLMEKVETISKFNGIMEDLGIRKGK